ncbi:MAG: exo-alpha-sialidase [Deltaproteobacteria bacterium]|nr:exo-alpha-sialidase [Deltaproteobacteria bacterium]
MIIGDIPAGSIISADYDTWAGIELIYSVGVDPDDYDEDLGYSKTIYAGVYGKGVWKASDGGKNWISISTMAAGQSAGFGMGVLCIAINEDSPDEIYAGTKYNGLFKSLNAGATWIKLTGTEADPINESVVQCIVLESAPGGVNNIWIGGKKGIHYSTDGGATWGEPSTKVNSFDPENVDVRAIARDSNDGTLFAATFGDVLDNSSAHGGVYTSADGDIWVKLTDLADDIGAHAIDSLDVSGKSGADTLFAGTEGRSVFKSTDSGTVWTKVNGSDGGKGLTNTLFATTRSLHSGRMREAVLFPQTATFQPMDDWTIDGPGYGSFPTIYNKEIHGFYYQVCDDLGHRLPQGTTYSVTASAGQLYGDVSGTLGDDICDDTDYYVQWHNNITSDEDILAATLTLNIRHPYPGGVDVSTHTIYRDLFKPLTVEEEEALIEVDVASVAGDEFYFVTPAEGGSNTTYTYSHNSGVTAASIDSDGVYTFVLPAPLGKDEKVIDKITIVDDATGAKIEIPVEIIGVESS